jgi:hypothetical protein
LVNNHRRNDMTRNDEIFLGRLGNRDGINVAKVEVCWGDDVSIGENAPVEHGYYLVHATGDEPEIAEAGEYGSIYTIFENLVSEAMDAKQERGDFDWWETNDTSAV